MINLQAFHELSQQIDYRAVLLALLDEFHHGTIADPDRTHEAHVVATELRPLTATWDAVLPPFPDCPWRRRTITWEYHRGRRDAYLRQLIITLLRQNDASCGPIVNPATVFGRHARSLARALPGIDVLGTDIDATWNRLHRVIRFWKLRDVPNYQFVRESIFDPDVTRRPTAVTFWGACGSVSDAIMDYAIATNTPLLICRTCCHDNIGGNTHIVPRPGLLNRFFTWKNAHFQRVKRRQTGYYFCDRYGADTYPRSSTASALMDANTMIAIAQNSVDSDICRSLIDLDRCLYLRQHGYDVLYRDELFVACARGKR